MLGIGCTGLRIEEPVLQRRFGRTAADQGKRCGSEQMPPVASHGGQNCSLIDEGSRSAQMCCLATRRVRQWVVVGRASPRSSAGKRVWIKPPDVKAVDP